MKVYNLEPLNFSTAAKSKLEKLGHYFESSKEALEISLNKKDVDVIITRLRYYLSDVFFSQFPNLKYVLSATTGQNHIDVDYLKHNSIRFISLKGETEFLEKITSTPQLAFGLILNLCRNITIASKSVANGEWNRNLFFGNQLDGKKIGILGFGRTGKILAKYSTAFNMQVLYFDPNVTEEQPHFIKVDSLEYLFKNSDIISIHVNLELETVDLINKKLLQLASQKLILINTSRGEIINESDLVNWLKANPQAKYGTDVLSKELIDIKESKIWQFAQKSNQILITPHIGGASFDALELCEEYIVDKLVLELNTSN